MCHDLREGSATGIQWVEARDAAKHPPMHRTAPTTKNHLTQGSVVLRLRTPGLWSQVDLGLNLTSAIY